jgi:DNA-binding transcriptional regulator YdaS (Cro superfamily)
MTSGCVRLNDWIERSKLNQRAAAKILGVHPVVLCQWLSGQRTPGLDNAHLIEKVTGISTESWLLTPISPAATESEPEPVKSNIS